MSEKKNDYYYAINNPITFSSDELLVRNYKFNLTYDELVNNSQRTRLARRNKRNGTNIIPRRQNAWILYLRDKSASRDMKGFQSKKIAEMWSEESKEVVEVYEAAARLAAARHMEKYGLDYKYIPKKTRNKTSRIPITPPTTPPLQFPIVPMTPMTSPSTTTPPSIAENNDNINIQFSTPPTTPPSEQEDNYDINEILKHVSPIILLSFMEHCDICRDLCRDQIGLYDFNFYPNINVEKPSEQ